MKTKDLARRFHLLVGKRDEICRLKASETERGLGCGARVESSYKALEIAKLVALSTQRQLEFRLGELASLALREVFGDSAPRLIVNFVERRGKTECDIMFQKGDNPPVSPIGSSGRGAIDVASFALRLTLFGMDNRASRPIMILDEPFSKLSRNLTPIAGRLLRELSSRLGIQFLIISHDRALIDSADRTFEVELVRSKRRGQLHSVVTRIH